MAIAKQKLERWQECETQRLELQRQAKVLETEKTQLEAEFEAELKATGKQSCKRHGWLLAYIQAKVNVSWKDAFIKECGAEKATALQEEAAKKDKQKFTLTPPAAV